MPLLSLNMAHVVGIYPMKAQMAYHNLKKQVIVSESKFLYALLCL